LQRSGDEQPGDVWSVGRGREMKCIICKHGETQPGTTTVTLERDNLTLVAKGVPAEVCSNCGEEYADEEITSRLLGVAEAEARAGVQFEVRDYVAA